MRDVVILDGARTPFGEFCGFLRDIVANDLGVVAARAAMERSGITPGDIDHVVFGNAMQTSNDCLYGARHVALKSGIPLEVPAVTINTFCGSGLQALVYGAQLIQLGEADICLVGGMENLSQSPHVIRGGRWGGALGKGEIEDTLYASMIDTFNETPMALNAENMTLQYNISREEQDEYAHRSLSAAVKARDAGYFREEIAPVRRGNNGKTLELWDDEHIREISLEELAKYKPLLRPNGGITAGNSHGITDGAAALVLSSRRKAKELGLSPKGRILSYAVCGVDPDTMGIGPVPAVRQAAEKAKMKAGDFDLYEINEAFAVQYLVCERELGLDRDKVNVNGGAIAIGHPLAASGARLALTMLYEMHRRDVETGVAALAVGGGQGIAAVFEKM